MKQVMKIQLVLLCVLLALTGCTTSSTVRNVELNELVSKAFQLCSDWYGIMEFSFQDDVQGTVLYLEQWENGNCVDSELIAYGGTSRKESLYITSKILQDDNQLYWKGSQWELLSDAEGIDTRYEPIIIKFPDSDVAFSGFTGGFLGEADKKTVKLVPGQNYILAMQAYALPERGVPIFSCETLMEEPENIKEYDCIVLLRLNTYAAEEEAEAVGKNQLKL